LAIDLVQMMIDPSSENASAAALSLLLSSLHLKGPGKQALESAAKKGETAIIEHALDPAHAKVVKDAVVNSLAAAGKATPPKRVIGEAAELAGAWILHGEGHEVLGALQNSSGQGIDLITKVKGVFYFWEIKGNGAEFSWAQKDGTTFIVDRVREVIDHPERYKAATVALAKDAYEAIRTGHFGYAGFRITGL
jgi:hypothetical protein